MTRSTPRKKTVAVAGAVLAGGLFAQVTGPVAPAGAAPVSTAELFARQAFTDATRNADPDAAALATAVAELDAGRSKAQFVWGLLMSDDGREAFVEYEFERLLDRPVDPQGLATFSARLEAGTSRAAIRSLLVGSNEYFTNAGGTNEGYVNAIFADLLGRDADPAGRTYWVNQLNAGQSRVKVANSFGNLSEGRRVRTDVIFRIYLDRGVDPSGAAYWSNRLAAGATEERLISTLAGSTEYTRVATTVPAPEAVVLLDQAGALTYRTPGAPDRTVTPVGVTAGTTLVGIDVRPATGVLHALGSDGQLYAITSVGTADKVGGPIAGFDASAGVGVDYNPVPDALRVVTGSANYRINATTGAVLGEGAPDSGLPGTLQYVPGDVNEGITPQVTSAAYTNSTRGLPRPTATALFDLDTGTDALVQQNPANAGNLTTIGDLRLDATGVGGFDVSPDGTQVAYAVLTTASGQGLWKIDLTTGEPKLLDELTGASPVVGLAVVGATTVVPTENALGLSSDGTSIVSFTTTDTAVTATQVVVGQNVGTTLVALDVRPATGELFALGSDGQLYTVDLSVPAVATATRTAVQTRVGDGELDLSQGVGFDFNPAADRLRITVGDKNFRLVPDGTIAGEGPAGSGDPGTLQYVAGDPGFGTTPQANGAAYTNSYRSATLPAATALFDIDSARDVLVRQNPANDGNLTTIGALGVSVDGVNGFDVSGGAGQTAYAVFSAGGTDGLYRVDLATGATARVGTLPAGLSGLAIR